MWKQNIQLNANAFSPDICQIRPTFQPMCVHVCKKLLNTLKYSSGVLATVLKKICQKSENFLLRVQKDYLTKYFCKQTSSKIFSGHVECSYYNHAEKLQPNSRNFFAQSPIINIDLLIFSKNIFYSSKSSSEH